MDVSVLFLIALALTGAAEVKAGPIEKSGELKEVLKEFLALVPRDRIVEIIQEYLKKDAEVQAIDEYLNCDALRDFVKKVESIDGVIEFYNYLQDAGLDVHALVNKLHEAIGLPALEPRVLAQDVAITGGLAGLIADIKAILPIYEIKALYHKKIESSPAFAEFIQRFKLPRSVIEAFFVNEEFHKIIDFAEDAGVDMEPIVDFFAVLFGVEFDDDDVSST